MLKKLKVSGNKSIQLAVLGSFNFKISVCSDSLRILRKVLGDRHPEVAKSYTALGNVLLQNGKPGEAYQAFKAAVAGKDADDQIDEQTFYTLCNMAKSLNDQQEYSEAERVYKDIVRFHKLLAKDPNVGEGFHENVVLGSILHAFGKVLLQQNKYFEAENVFKGAMKKLMDRYGVLEHPEVDACRCDLYEALVAQGKRKEADDMGL